MTFINRLRKNHLNFIKKQSKTLAACKSLILQQIKLQASCKRYLRLQFLVQAYCKRYLGKIKTLAA